MDAKGNYSFCKKLTENQEWSLNLAMCYIVIGHLVYAYMNGLLTKGIKDLGQVNFFKFKLLAHLTNLFKI